MEATGAALLVIAFAIEVLQQQPRWEIRFSLGAAVVLITAAALSTAVRRAWLASLGGLALILAVSQLVRMTKEPLLNGLNIVPLRRSAAPPCWAAARYRAAAVSRGSGLRPAATARNENVGVWARELHDGTLQELAAVQIVLSAAVGTGQSAAMNDAVNQARSLIANQITSLRHLIVEMRPFALDQLDSSPLLRRCAGAPRKPSGWTRNCASERSGTVSE